VILTSAVSGDSPLVFFGAFLSCLAALSSTPKKENESVRKKKETKKKKEKEGTTNGGKKRKVWRDREGHTTTTCGIKMIDY
jgi:hypothetical protein